jgi:hypothetical protein
MSKTTRIVATVSFLVLGACAVSRVDPLSVPLVYTTNPKNAGVFGGLSCNAISQVQVSDARSDKSVIGIRTHESKPLTAKVTSATDPAVWVQSGVQGFLGQNGIVPQGHGPKLAISLDSLHTTETIWHRASYDASLALTASLQSPAGKICWKQTVEGTGGNYGYAGSIPDYQETLNAALDSASLKLVQSPGFKDALCQCAN